MQKAGDFRCHLFEQIDVIIFYRVDFPHPKPDFLFRNDNRIFLVVGTKYRATAPKIV
jgi:hypothetical protein